MEEADRGLSEILTNLLISYTSDPDSPRVARKVVMELGSIVRISKEREYYGTILVAY